MSTRYDAIIIGGGHKQGEIRRHAAKNPPRPPRPPAGALPFAPFSVSNATTDATANELSIDLTAPNGALTALLAESARDDLGHLLLRGIPHGEGP